MSCHELADPSLPVLVPCEIWVDVHRHRPLPTLGSLLQPACAHRVADASSPASAEDGVVSLAELGRMLARHGMSHDQIARTYTGYDRDASGYLDLRELKRLLNALRCAICCGLSPNSRDHPRSPEVARDRTTPPEPCVAWSNLLSRMHTISHASSILSARMLVPQPPPPPPAATPPLSSPTLREKDERHEPARRNRRPLHLRRASLPPLRGSLRTRRRPESLPRAPSLPAGTGRVLPPDAGAP